MRRQLGWLVGTLALGLGGPASAQNLDATVTPPGFTYPVVARNTGDATPNNAVQSAALQGDASNTYVSFAIEHLGPGAFPSWQAQILLDNVPISTQTVGASLPGSYQWLNLGPFTVAGGRHTLSSIADLNNAVAEENEADNTFTRQSIWSPPLLSAPAVRPAPPDPGSFPEPNADTFQGPNTNQPWVVSVAPLDPSDDYDLRLYSGFALSPQIGASSQRGYGTEFIELPQSVSVPTSYPAVVRDSVGAAGNCLVDLATASGRVHFSPGDFSFLAQTLPVHRLADIYQFHVNAGQRNYVTLRTPPGADDLAFAVYASPTAKEFMGGRSRASSDAASSPVSSQIDTATYAEPLGWPVNVVVYRPDAQRAGETVTYDLEWSVTKLVDVEDRVVGRVALSARPNPVRGTARFALDLPRAAATRLSIHDVRGREVARAFDGAMPAGPSTVRWQARDADGRALRAGVYFAKLEQNGELATTRLVVLD